MQIIKKGKIIPPPHLPARTYMYFTTFILMRQSDCVALNPTVMKNILLLTALLALTGEAISQKEMIKRFTITVYSRGHRSQTIIQQDSTVEFRGTGELTISKSVTPKKKWNCMVGSIKEYKLADLVNLPSPSNERARDAASAGEVKINTNLREYQCGTFDWKNPPAKLSALLRCK
jgi:hypothetical protein